MLCCVDVIHGRGELLILHILIKVVIFQVGKLLGRYHPAHQRHGRIVFSDVAFALSLHHHLVKAPRTGLELDGQVIGACRHLHGLSVVAQTAEGEHPALVAVDGEASFAVTRHGYALALIRYAGIGHRIAVGGVQHLARNLRLGRQRGDA